jgi:hypothetical protein
MPQSPLRLQSFRCARWLCRRPGLAPSTRLPRRHRRQPLRQQTLTPQAFNAASRSSTVALKADPAALRLARREVQAVFRIRAHRVNSPAVLVPSIPLVPVSPAPAPVVRAARARVRDLAHVQDSALHAQAVLVLLRVARRLRAKRPALRVPPVRREAVVASSIPRPKKAQ